MRTWPRASLGDCCEIVSGATPRTDRNEYWNGDIPWATPRDLRKLGGSVLRTTAQRITREGYNSCSTTLLPVGAVLFTSRAPVGLVAIAGQPICTNQGFKSLVPGPDVDYTYLFWCLRQYGSAIERRGSGTTFVEVSKAVLSRFEIPLPPLAEQRRIAGMLDKADAIRQKRRETLPLLGELFRSAFLEMFGDPTTNTKGWSTLTLGEMLPERLLIVDGPFGSSLKPDSYVATGVRVIRNFNIKDDSFNGSEFKYITDEKFEQVKRSEVQSGDLLISTKGTLGNVCLMPALTGRSVLSATGTVRVRLPRGAAIRREFLVSQMVMPQYKQYVKRFEAGTNQKYLNLGNVRQFSLIVPPLELQDSFGEIRNRVRHMKLRQAKSTEVAENLWDSLLGLAFN